MNRQSFFGLLIVLLVALLILLIVGRHQDQKLAKDPLWAINRTENSLDQRQEYLQRTFAGITSTSPISRLRLLLQESERFLDQGQQFPDDLDVSGVREWLANYLRTGQLDGQMMGRWLVLLEMLGSDSEVADLRRHWQERIQPLHQQVDHFIVAVDRALDLLQDGVEDAEEQVLDALSSSRVRWRRVLLEAQQQQLKLAADPYTRQHLGALMQRLAALEAIAAARSQGAGNGGDIAGLLLVESDDFLVPDMMSLWNMVIREVQLDYEEDIARLALVASESLPGSRWWLLLPLLLGLGLLAWGRRCLLLGPRPVDPSAETLENVDPVDLDTEALTMLDEYGSSSGATTGSLSPIEGDSDTQLERDLTPTPRPRQAQKGDSPGHEA